MKERIMKLFEKKKNEILEELLDEILSSSNEVVVALCYNKKKDKLFVSRFANTVEIYGMQNVIPVYVIELPAEYRDSLTLMFEDTEEEFSEEEKRKIMKETIEINVEEAIKELEIETPEG